MTDQSEFLAEQFEQQRPRLRAVAYRMLGSLSEADDAVQEAWLRLSRAGASDVENLGAWLTTVVARLCLNTLRARNTRREVPWSAIPDPVISSPDGVSPEDEALLADSVGLAMLIVLDTLSPAERIAFVLHDMFEVPFDDIANVTGRTPQASRQLASRARRRLRGHTPEPDESVAVQREVIDAYMRAAHDGDFEGLLAVLDPDVVLRADADPLFPVPKTEVRGAHEVATRATTYARVDLEVRPALVNGAAGAVTIRDGKVFSVVGVTVRNRRIVEIDILADPARVSAIDLAILEG